MANHTIYVADKALWNRAKEKAYQKRMSMSKYIEYCLREMESQQ